MPKHADRPDLPPGVVVRRSVELTGLYGLMLKLYAALFLLSILL